MDQRTDTERIATVVVGGGQAGLSAGYHLARRGIPFVILDADERIGDHWRNHYDSLRLYSPARSNGLPGMRFPASSYHYPTGREMGDYLESYAKIFDLPVREGAPRTILPGLETKSRSLQRLLSPAATASSSCLLP